MAQIFLNIEADSADDLRNTLAGLLAVAAVAAPVAAEPRLTAAAPAPAAEPLPVSDAAEASPPAGETPVDSAGVVLDEAVHTGTQNKDGTWRRKKGAPANAGNSSTGATGAALNGSASTEAAGQHGEPAPTSDAGRGDDDEFAAFAAAAAETEHVEVPARSWAEADLSKLCNQAATKLGSADKVKELIAQYVPEGEVAHSRNILVDDREAFAAAIEAAAGIQFAG